MLYIDRMWCTTRLCPRSSKRSKSAVGRSGISRRTELWQSLWRTTGALSCPLGMSLREAKIVYQCTLFVCASSSFMLADVLG